MLLPLKVAQGVRDGTVTLAYRRWRKQDVEPGRRFTSAAGMIRVEDVEVVDADAITDEEAVLAGHRDADRLRSRARRVPPASPGRRTACGWRGPARTRGSRCAPAPT